MKKFNLPFSGKGQPMISLFALTLVLFSFMFQASMAQLPCSQKLTDELGLQLLPCQELHPLDCGFCEKCDLQYICVANEDGFQLDHFDQSIECDPSLNHAGFDDYWFTYDWSVNGVTVTPPDGQCLNVTSFNFGDRVCVNVEVRAAGTGISTPPICFIPLCYELEDLCDTGSVCCDERRNSVQNGTFDPSCAFFCSPFFTGCVPNWRSTHGSPRNPAATAEMWSSGEIGEGIFNTAGFGSGGLHTVAGGTYALSFTISGSGSNGTANFILSNGLAAGGTAACAGTGTPGVPIGSQLIWSESVTNLSSGATEVCCVFRAERNFSQLWIFPQSTGGTVLITVDDVCLSRSERPAVGSGCFSRRRTSGSDMISDLSSIDDGFFALYPNPASETAHFNYRINTASSATLYDLTGAKVWEQTLDPNGEGIDIPVQNLPQGIYLMQVEADGVRVYSEKLLVK